MGCEALRCERGTAGTLGTFAFQIQAGAGAERSNHESSSTRKYRLTGLVASALLLVEAIGRLVDQLERLPRRHRAGHGRPELAPIRQPVVTREKTLWRRAIRDLLR